MNRRMNVLAAVIAHLVIALFAGQKQRQGDLLFSRDAAGDPHPLRVLGNRVSSYLASVAAPVGPT